MVEISYKSINPDGHFVADQEKQISLQDIQFVHQCSGKNPSQPLLWVPAENAIKASDENKLTHLRVVTGDAVNVYPMLAQNVDKLFNVIAQIDTSKDLVAIEAQSGLSSYAGFAAAKRIVAKKESEGNVTFSFQVKNIVPGSPAFEVITIEQLHVPTEHSGALYKGITPDPYCTKSLAGAFPCADLK